MKIGDRVSWKTPQGKTEGKIVERKTKDFQFDKQHFKASEDEPKFIVESAKTGAKAAHAESALDQIS
jgi:hypothetical protein